MTAFPVTALRSVDLGTPDIEGSERFYTQVWGLDVVERAGPSVYLRATGADHHVLALYPSDRPELRSVTFRAASEDALHRIAAAAPAAGAEVVSAPGANPGPDGGICLTIREPQGGALRFVYGDHQDADARPVANRPLRLAHVNINSTDVDEAAAFYRDALGFRLTDRSKLMAFARCNSDHHAVVLAEAHVNGLNHIAFLVPDLESVMRAAGRLVDHGFPIAWGVGRHGPGDNVFAYFVDPTGVVIEYTAEVLQVDDDYVVRGPDEWKWPPGRTDHWGIAPPKSEAVKAAQTAVLHAAGAST
ncbi:MAG: VOC family protein [Acetobacteraceae bacterium]|nr:VOC family protein [Acetobacteraceae bacterium]